MKSVMKREGGTEVQVKVAQVTAMKNKIVIGRFGLIHVSNSGVEAM